MKRLSYNIFVVRRHFLSTAPVSRRAGQAQAEMCCLDGRIIGPMEMGFHASLAIMCRPFYLRAAPSQEVCRMSASTERLIIALLVIPLLAIIFHRLKPNQECLSLRPFKRFSPWLRSQRRRDIFYYRVKVASASAP
jgi:hypothetical protein